MQFTYTITSYDSATGTTEVVYKAEDPELPDIGATLLLPNAQNTEQLNQLVVDNIPTHVWARAVLSKDLQPVIGQPQTAYRDLLRPVPEMHIVPIKL